MTLEKLLNFSWLYFLYHLKIKQLPPHKIVSFLNEITNINELHKFSSVIAFFKFGMRY